MKQILLFLAVAISSVQINAQMCTQAVTNFGNNLITPSYNISGDVEVVYNNDETVTLNLASNYSTAFGPDVRAYLINSDGASDAALRAANINDLEHVQFGLTSSSGAQTFTISAPSNIEDYDKVFFYCLDFNAFWDFGSYSSFSPSNCSILSIEDVFFNENVKIYQNLNADIVTVSAKNNTTQGQVQLFNLLGKEVFQSNNDINQNINVANFNSGVYILKINSQGKTASKKLIIQ